MDIDFRRSFTKILNFSIRVIKSYQQHHIDLGDDDKPIKKWLTSTQLIQDSIDRALNGKDKFDENTLFDIHIGFYPKYFHQVFQDKKSLICRDTYGKWFQSIKIPFSSKPETKCILYLGDIYLLALDTAGFFRKIGNTTAQELLYPDALLLYFYEIMSLFFNDKDNKQDIDRIQEIIKELREKLGLNQNKNVDQQISTDNIQGMIQAVCSLFDDLKLEGNGKSMPNIQSIANNIIGNEKIMGPITDGFKKSQNSNDPTDAVKCIADIIKSPEVKEGLSQVLKSLTPENSKDKDPIPNDQSKSEDKEESDVE